MGGARRTRAPSRGGSAVSVRCRVRQLPSPPPPRSRRRAGRGAAPLAAAPARRLGLGAVARRRARVRVWRSPVASPAASPAASPSRAGRRGRRLCWRSVAPVCVCPALPWRLSPALALRRRSSVLVARAAPPARCSFAAVSSRWACFRLCRGARALPPGLLCGLSSLGVDAHTVLNTPGNESEAPTRPGLRRPPAVAAAR